MRWAEIDPRNRGRIARATIVLAVLAGAILSTVFLAGLVTNDADPELGQVKFPEPGEAHASLLNNGDQAWVVVTIDEVPVVLSAVSPYQLEDAVLVEWCRDAQAFVDPASGSLWDAQGRYVAGPAAYDLARYEFATGDEGTVSLLSVTEPGERSTGEILNAECDAGMSTLFDP